MSLKVVGPTGREQGLAELRFQLSGAENTPRKREDTPDAAHILRAPTWFFWLLLEKRSGLRIGPSGRPRTRPS